MIQAWFWQTFLEHQREQLPVHQCKLKPARAKLIALEIASMCAHERLVCSEGFVACRIPLLE